MNKWIKKDPSPKKGIGFYDSGRFSSHRQHHFPAQDLTSELPDAPHKEEVFLHDCVQVVGRLAENVER